MRKKEREWCWRVDVGAGLVINREEEKGEGHKNSGKDGRK